MTNLGATQTIAFTRDFQPAPARENARTQAFDTMFAFRATPPTWLAGTVSKIKHLDNLDENWDSYGARPIDSSSIAFARRLITKLAEVECVGAPSVGGTPDGYVGFSWDAGDWSLDAEVLSDGEIQYVYLDERNSTKDVEASTTDLKELLLLLTQWP